MGKGDTYRPVNQKKYERNYLRVFGIKCPDCGKGIVISKHMFGPCKTCGGVGYVERK